MNGIRKEFAVFFACPHSMRVLMVSNMIYALVLPVIEIFVAAYVMRNSRAVDKVVAYQLSIYSATPLAFFINGKLLGRVGSKHLYAIGMVLSGLAMMLMMELGILTRIGIAILGFTMGLATGIFWANRGFLALMATNDDNRNYFYGVENFVATLNAVVVPALIGWFISGTVLYGWLGGVANRAYHMIAVAVFVLTVAAAAILERGTFRMPEHTRFVYFHFHPLWWRMLALALLKGLAQGYIVTAPAMLIMLLVGQEGTLGTAQAIGGVFSACLHLCGWPPGRAPASEYVFSVGLSLFLVGAVTNALLFNALGVFIFIACLLLAKPHARSCLLSDPVAGGRCRLAHRGTQQLRLYFQSRIRLVCRAMPWAAGYSWQSLIGGQELQHSSMRSP